MHSKTRSSQGQSKQQIVSDRPGGEDLIPASFSEDMIDEVEDEQFSDSQSDAYGGHRKAAHNLNMQQMEEYIANQPNMGTGNISLTFQENQLSYDQNH